MLSFGPNMGLLVHGAAGEEHYDEIIAQFRGLDLFLQCAILDRDLATPPGSPADGAAYIVAGSPTGAWAGHATHVARYSSVLSAWEFYTPHPGWGAYVVDEAVRVTFNGSAWISDASLIGSDLMSFKGAIDASSNPNYPAADAGDVYRISVAGKIGGASGPNVEPNDTLYCTTDGSVSGNHATVGSNWDIVQANIDGAVYSTAPLTNHGVVLGKGTRELGATAEMADGQLLVGQTGADPLPKTVSGDLTALATGAFTIANDAVTNAKLANVPTRTLKGRLSGGTGDPEDLTFNQIRQLVNIKQVLTDAATIAVDCDLGLNCRVVLGGNRTLGNPTNLVDGDVLNIRIHQDGTGGRTLTYASKYKFPGGAPTLSTAANARDILVCQYDSTDDTLECVLTKAFA